MNILVCVKQVPDTTSVKIDPVTHTLIRKGVPSILNTFDGFALEFAVRLKEQLKDNSFITLLSMGPEQAMDAIRDGLSVGGDEGYLVSGREFGGSDTLATSYILSSAIKKIEEIKNEKFDIILCGKQAIDGDTGQVGPEIAEHLDYPQITYATELMDVTEDRIRIKKETAEGYEVLESAFPLVVSVTKTAFEPRFASIKSRLAANRADIPVITVSDLDNLIDLSHCGLKGSPTRVKKSFTPVHEQHCEYIEADTLALAGKDLAQRLSDDKKY